MVGNIHPEFSSPFVDKYLNVDLNVLLWQSDFYALTE